MAKKSADTDPGTVRVKNNTTSIVTIPYNTPRDLATAALAAGVRALSQTTFAKGQEAFAAELAKNPHAYITTGDWHANPVELQPGQEGEVATGDLLPAAFDLFKRMTSPGGSLTVL